MRIALFANTGLGNKVLEKLLTLKEEVVLVVTRSLPGEFPYYKEIDLDIFCKEKGIPYVTNISVNEDAFLEHLSALNIDLILVSTFNEILREELIRIPKLGIYNYHPSLLPLYRGPSPIQWVLLENQSQTGITIHKLEKKIDSGVIIIQKAVSIDMYQSCGELFEQLSITAGEITIEFIQLLKKNKTIKGLSNKTTKTKYYRKPIGQNKIYSHFSTEEIFNRIRAFTPFPGVLLIHDNKEYKILKYTVSKENISLHDELRINEESSCFELNIFNKPKINLYFG